jgi:hypothetical protein
MERGKWQSVGWIKRGEGRDGESQQMTGTLERYGYQSQMERLESTPSIASAP